MPVILPLERNDSFHRKELMLFFRRWLKRENRWMRARTHPEPAPSETRVVTKAAIRAAARLGIKSNVLAKVLGVSEPTVSRMRQGEYVVRRGQKDFELAVLFVRLYRSLDAIVGGDDAVAASWLQNRNNGLGGIPLDLIQSVTGLVNVIQYLDAKRAAV